MQAMSKEAIELRNSWAKENVKFFESLSPEEMNVINSLAQALS